MKKIILITSLAVMTAMMVTSCDRGASNQVTSIEVTIGNQVWMTENLNVDKFRNGDPIPEAKTDEEWLKAIENKQPAWCYYDNDPDNGAKYGKLYNWYAVSDPRGLAPAGYHIPGVEEWTTLTNYLGEPANYTEELLAFAAHKMKSTSGWVNKGNGTNSSGFSALPGGCRHTIYGLIGFPQGMVSFRDVGEKGLWWSDTVEYIEILTWNRYVPFSYIETYSNKECGFSVRCVKD